MARKAYDDWQRLVEAVLKRKQMLEMFHAPSRTPSISSIASDTSSSSSLDHQPFDHAAFPLLFMNTALLSDEKLESRKHVEEQILENLLNDEVSTIGIFGTGGIGKTTMAKRIREMVKKETLFDEVIMTVVGENQDIRKIQSGFAEVLGLELEENNVQVRAIQLSSVMKGLKNLLIILDDVWARLVLEDVGIPNCIGEKRFKIMFTSRDHDVLMDMQVQKVFPVQALPEDEAWSLFQEKVGTKVDDSILQPIGEEFVKECKGSPFVLNILGSILKERDGPFWGEALAELRSHASSQVSDIVYSSLKLSSMLLSKEERCLFILCCLFKDGSDIFLEELVRFGKGLNIKDQIMSLDEARTRVCELTGVLKDHSLLEDGCDPTNVKMHDVVRDVAITIASEFDRVMVNHDAKLESWEEKDDDTHISLISMLPAEHSEELTCPNIIFLRLQGNLNPLVVPDNFFCGMMKLNVLVISCLRIESLPRSLHLITQLQTLHLHSCSVKSISEVGHLVNLEILSCYDCPRIEILPAEIGRLGRLRLLEVYKCQNLKTVVPGVISRFVLLEELKMQGSFAQWQQKSNASLDELQSLSRLVNLEIEVEDHFEMITFMDPFPSLSKFHIKVGPGDIEVSHSHPYKIREAQKTMLLSMPEGRVPGYWVRRLLKRVENLSLKGNCSMYMFTKLKNVKKLRISHCPTVSHLGQTSDEGVFRLLESLDLEDLVNLREVCHDRLPCGSFLNLTELKLYELPSLLQLLNYPSPDSPLVNLKSVDIRNCKLLPYLFTLSTARSFEHLEELRILFCGKMKEILFNDLDETSTAILFPRLKKLILNSLPSLIAFCRGIKSMQFPQLQFLSIRNLSKLKGLLPQNGSFPVFFEQEVELYSLKELSLHGLEDTISQIWSRKVPIGHFFAIEKLHFCACNKLKHLFSPSIVTALVSLKELNIRDSLMIAEVIVNIEQETERTLFPRLERIHLWQLRSLRSFCQWRHELELPSLRHVSISLCPEMQTFTLGSLSTPKLEHFELDHEQITHINDLNGALNRRLRSKLALKGSSSTVGGGR